MSTHSGISDNMKILDRTIMFRIYYKIKDKGEDREENIETMDIVTAIESFGGFVFSTETKTMPKEYLTMH